jgi:hypothetical protein
MKQNPLNTPKISKTVSRDRQSFYFGYHCNNLRISTDFMKHPTRNPAADLTHAPHKPPDQPIRKTPAQKTQKYGHPQMPALSQKMSASASSGDICP